MGTAAERASVRSVDGANRGFECPRSRARGREGTSLGIPEGDLRWLDSAEAKGDRSSARKRPPSLCRSTARSESAGACGANGTGRGRAEENSEPGGEGTAEAVGSPPRSSPRSALRRVFSAYR
ncbi:hypothetical protein KM043_000919 [Ampulex compressa]|nr:hypothetical protein KM043_000919 [Ampulex compressa]